MSETVIKMEGMVKAFHGTLALKNVDFEVEKGEIHALLGENGAGKSTLIKMITGAYQADEGEITVGNEKFPVIPIKEIDRLGIAAVYQDLKLAPGVSVLENISMGALPKKSGIFMNRKKANEIALKALKKTKSDIDPNVLVQDLRAADRVVVAIAKALSKDAKLLILDEPTAILADDDVGTLFKILKELANQGVSILYISHRLEEIFALCDRVTVLRDGYKILTKDVKELTNDELIEAIAGEMVKKNDAYYPAKIGEIALKTEGLSNPPNYENVSISVREGEVVGLYGLVGAGKSEFLKGIFGEMPPTSGKVFVNGGEYKPKSPRRSVSMGIGLVPEDRNSEGILPRMPVHFNSNLSSYYKISRAGVVYPKIEKDWSLKVIKDFKVKYNNLDQEIDGLSGGNQQKVVVSKWTGTDVTILLLDEPTAGIDVGARRDIFKVSQDLVAEGKAIIYCSSYLPELFEVCDRILVMSRGKISGEFTRDEFNERNIMRSAYDI